MMTGDGIAETDRYLVIATVEKVIGVRTVIFTFDHCPSDPYYATLFDPFSFTFSSGDERRTALFGVELES